MPNLRFLHYVQAEEGLNSHKAEWYKDEGILNVQKNQDAYRHLHKQPHIKLQCPTSSLRILFSALETHCS